MIKSVDLGVAPKEIIFTNNLISCQHMHPNQAQNQSPHSLKYSATSDTTPRCCRPCGSGTYLALPFSSLVSINTGPQATARPTSTRKRSGLLRSSKWHCISKRRGVGCPTGVSERCTFPLKYARTRLLQRKKSTLSEQKAWCGGTKLQACL